jgi:hypothetical protein
VVGVVVALTLSLAATGAESDRAKMPTAQAFDPTGTPDNPARPRYRFIFASEQAGAAVAANGWNLVDVGSKWDADRVPAGTHGLVWIGDYDNSTCAWQVSDEELTRRVTSMASDPKVIGFFFSDEPNPFLCPSAPAEHKARSALIHRLAPGKITVMVVDSNRGAESLKQIPLWRGAADYIGLDPYPCYPGAPCIYSRITSIIDAADQAGLRYWGVVQAFADSEWRWPTPAEERHMLSQWAKSRQKGYMTFAWTWAGHTLSGNKRLLTVLRRFNRGSLKLRTQ